MSWVRNLQVVAGFVIESFLKVVGICRCNVLLSLTIVVMGGIVLPLVGAIARCAMPQPVVSRLRLLFTVQVITIVRVVLPTCRCRSNLWQVPLRNNPAVGLDLSLSAWTIVLRLLPGRSVINLVPCLVSSALKLGILITRGVGNRERLTIVTSRLRRHGKGYRYIATLLFG